MKSTNVLFVCLGNICRSPTADGIFAGLVQDAGLADCIRVDSAGTAAWHIGKSPDTRSQVAAKNRGYDLSGLRARQFEVSDFEAFDYILAMDTENLQHMQAMRPSMYTGHLGLFLGFSQQNDYHEVPDPYYGGDQGFETVLDLVEDASRGLLESIIAR